MAMERAVGGGGGGGRDDLVQLAKSDIKRNLKGMIWRDSTAGVHKQLGPQTMSAGSYSLKGMILTGSRAWCTPY